MKLCVQRQPQQQQQQSISIKLMPSRWWNRGGGEGKSSLCALLSSFTFFSSPFSALQNVYFFLSARQSHGGRSCSNFLAVVPKETKFGSSPLRRQENRMAAWCRCRCRQCHSRSQSMLDLSSYRLILRRAAVEKRKDEEMQKMEINCHSQ